MTKRLTKWQISLGAILVFISTIAVAADVYRSAQSDGTYRYASQALDSSYMLYLKGEPSPSNLRLPANAHSADPLRQGALQAIIERTAARHAVEPALVRAVIEVESQFNPSARSIKGAAGAMQLMPATAVRYGVTQRTDPVQNIDAGVRYLKDLLALHQGNVALALASYNAGEGAVARHGRRIPPYRETMLYVAAVLSKLQTARAADTP